MPNKNTVSDTVTLRVVIINKYGLSRRPITNRWFEGFNLINFYAFNKNLEAKNGLKSYSFNKIRLNYITKGKKLKLGRPGFVLENVSSYDLKKYKFPNETQDVLFLGYNQNDTKPISSILISEYLFSIMIDDCNMERKIQLFDFIIESNAQMCDGFSVSNRSYKHFDEYIPKEISFINTSSSFSMFTGRLINYSSISLDNYISNSGHDFIHEEAKKTYYGQHNEFLKKKYSFDEFLNREREVYQKPFLIHR